MNIIPLPPRKVSLAPIPPDVRPLVWALSRMEPESLEMRLHGETPEESRARRAAGLDIFGELLAEFPAEYLGGDGGGDPVDALAARLVLDGTYGDLVSTLASLLILDGAA